MTKAGRARRRRAGDRRRPDRRSARAGRATSWPSTARRGRRSRTRTSSIKSAWRVAARPQTYFIDARRGHPVDPDRRGARRGLRAAVRQDRAVTAVAGVTGDRRRAGSSSATGRGPSSTASTSTSRPASWSRCSGRTARARPRPSRSSRATAGRTAARSRSSATDPWSAGRGHRARVGLMLQDGGFDIRGPAARDAPPVRRLPRRPARRRTSCSSWSGCGPWPRRRIGGCPAASASGWPWRWRSSGRPEVLVLDEPTAGMAHMLEQEHVVAEGEPHPRGLAHEELGPRRVVVDQFDGTGQPRRLPDRDGTDLLLRHRTLSGHLTGLRPRRAWLRASPCTPGLEHMPLLEPFLVRS